MPRKRSSKKNISPRILIYSWGYFVLKMGITPLGRFSSKRRFENQKPTKTKKQALCFSLLFDLFVLKMGIEPTLQRNWILNPARLPIPPLEH